MRRSQNVESQTSAVGWKVWEECFSRLNCSVALSTAERLRGATIGQGVGGEARGSHLSGFNVHKHTYRSHPTASSDSGGAGRGLSVHICNKLRGMLKLLGHGPHFE